ncbi:MAG: hypothetical protein KGR48_07960 [Alphaproteobacteria bacterium]|nr:hypothetical protein [Alphaproteobacteria bacterium]MDE2012064.1 hypothetical protein [Alphaproteobacteria bacterium]MDE2075264.1 hypothetical protein [Alphaproteobacteria bacterium]
MKRRRAVTSLAVLLQATALYVAAPAVADDSVIAMLDSWKTARVAIQDKIKEDEGKKAALLAEQQRLGESQQMLSTNLKHLHEDLDKTNTAIAQELQVEYRHDHNPPDQHCAACVDRYNAEAKAIDTKGQGLVERANDLQNNIQSTEAVRKQTNETVIENARHIHDLDNAKAKLGGTVKWVSQTYGTCLQLAADGASLETIKSKCGNIQFDGENIHLSNPQLTPRKDCFFQGPNCRAQAQ